jgi:hypothetical protein
MDTRKIKIYSFKQVCYAKKNTREKGLETGFVTLVMLNEIFFHVVKKKHQSLANVVIMYNFSPTREYKKFYKFLLF